jgi:hypothetical protein
VNAALQNLQVVHFPGNALSANVFSGEFSGYNVFAGINGDRAITGWYADANSKLHGFVRSP